VAVWVAACSSNTSSSVIADDAPSGCAAICPDASIADAGVGDAHLPDAHQPAAPPDAAVPCCPDAAVMPHADAPIAGTPDAPPAPVTAAFPIRIAGDKNHLVDANGAPFLVRGDSAWSLIVELSDADTTKYLDDRRARGFNAVLVNLIEHQ